MPKGSFKQYNDKIPILWKDERSVDVIMFIKHTTLSFILK